MRGGALFNGKEGRGDFRKISFFKGKGGRVGFRKILRSIRRSFEPFNKFFS